MKHGHVNTKNITRIFKIKPYTYYQNYYRIKLIYASMLGSIDKCRAIKIFLCGSGLVHRVAVRVVVTQPN